MTIFHLPFHSWLKNRRRALDLSVEELSDRVGCSPATLRKLENGDRRPSRQLAERLAQHLRITPEELATFVDYARSGISASAPAAHIPLIPTTHPVIDRRSPPLRPLTDLIGRDALVVEVKQLLLDQQRTLVTLIGPGGVGKTRLAQELAFELHAQFDDGALFVSLAAMNKPAAVLAAIAQELDLAPDLQRPAKVVLRDALRDRELLLVLDNLEQVIDVGAEIADLLAACQHVRILTTSRVALKVRGEYLLPVPPLELPALNHNADPTQIAQVPAVALFMARVQALAPQFMLTAANAEAVAAICARLDGLPLAIELVAARCKLLGAQNLLNQLQSGTASGLLGLVGAGPRDLPPRHRTLRAAIDWSYHLLSEAEQQLLRRLACFIGSWSLSAAEAVCVWDANDPETASAGAAIFAIEFLDRIAALCDSSLVQVLASDEDEPRFMLLETLREYALEQLTQSGEFAVLHRRHADYFFARTGTPAADLRRREQPARFNWLERENTNIRAALAFLSDVDPARGLEFAGRLWWFWCQRGYWLEGRDWLSGLLNRGVAARPEVLAEALVGLGALSFVLADFAAAQHHCTRSAELFRTLGDRRGLGYALTFLGMTVLRRGDAVQARILLEESVTEFRSTEDTWGLAHALNGLRQALVEMGDLVLARRIQEESVMLWRAVSDDWGLALALNGLGEIARYERNFSQATELYGESLRLFEASGDSGNTAILLHNLAQATLADGDPVYAAELFRRGLQIDHKLGNSEGMLEHLAGLGAAAAAQEQWQRAVFLLSYVITAGAPRSENFFPIDQKVLRAAVAQVDTALGPGTVTKASAGQSRSIDEILAYAFSDD